MAQGMNPQKMLKQMQKMQEDMARVQAELQQESVTASAGGGAVTARVSGGLELLEITIDPSAVDPEDVELLQDVIVAAVNEAMRSAQQLAQDRLGTVAGGLSGPGAPRPVGARAAPTDRAHALDRAAGRRARAPARHRPAQRPAAGLPHDEGAPRARRGASPRPSSTCPRSCAPARSASASPRPSCARSAPTRAATRRCCAWSRSPRRSCRSSGPTSTAAATTCSAGALSPIDGVDPEDLRIDELVARIGEDEVTELVIATNPTMSGEATALYLADLLRGPRARDPPRERPAGRRRPRARRRADARPGPPRAPGPVTRRLESPVRPRRRPDRRGDRRPAGARRVLLARHRGPRRRRADAGPRDAGHHRDGPPGLRPHRPAALVRRLRRLRPDHRLRRRRARRRTGGRSIS